MRIDPKRLPAWKRGQPLARLKGTPKQAQWAQAIREQMIDRPHAALSLELWRALHRIDDATWFIANKDKAPWNIGWPLEWMDPNSIPEEPPGPDEPDQVPRAGQHKYWDAQEGA